MSLQTSWPPQRRQTRNENLAPSPTTPTPLHRLSSLVSPSTTHGIESTPTPHSHTSLATSRRVPLTEKRVFRNGFAVKPQTPSSKPYSLNNPGRARQVPFRFDGYASLRALQPLAAEKWNEMAIAAGVLSAGESLRDFQVEAANVIIGRQQDICVIAPTGSGKSLLWVLPLLAQGTGISLVIIPFTSLGLQGEEKYMTTKIASTFLYSGSRNVHVLERIARGGEMHIVYICPEMLETPSVARVLYANSFREQLSGVYIDEAHSVKASLSWRPAFSNLHIFRKLIGNVAPLVPISATLPSPYRQSLEIYAGLRPGYFLLNLGNFRPELSTIVLPLRHAASTFLDLAFVLPLGSTFETVQSSIIYTDDIDDLTAMYWWFLSRALSMGLPDTTIDVLHAGLSEDHQRAAYQEFKHGRSKILVGSEKIGAGMDFPDVRLVVQFKCRGVTLVQWDQRRGRGGRRKGMTAVGVVLVEKSMTGEDPDSPSIKSPKTEDPGWVEFIQTDRCHERVVDKWLENPQRENEGDSCLTRCSNCNPHLSVLTQYVWVHEESFKHKSRTMTPEDKREMMYQRLIRWRSEVWKGEWKEKWPRYGPRDLVSDHDLRQIAQRAPHITTIDDIDAYP